MKTYACIICGRESAHEGCPPTLYPFCSERCKMVDLGRWFRGQYSIDRDLTPEDQARVADDRGRGAGEP
jgi:endogenous inhibitor of DNA gyrase (YacG/DUF329 family)